MNSLAYKLGKLFKDEFILHSSMGSFTPNFPRLLGEGDTMAFPIPEE